MSHVVVDDLGDLSPWRARTPGGTSSTAISIERGEVPRTGADTMTIRATSEAEGHRVERTRATIDLTAFPDLELWVRSDRPADGSESRPFSLELRVGSAQLAIGADGNSWHRLLPVAQADVWQPVLIALDDLPDAVRNAVTAVRFTCVDASVPFELTLDPLLAVTDELLSDVDAALLGRLGGTLELDDVQVTAVVEPSAQAPTEPFFRISNYAVRPAPERSPSAGTRTDFTEHGFAIRPPSVPFDLFYAIEAVADTRAEVAAMLEFALAATTPRSTLDVAGRPLEIEWVEAPPLELATVESRPTVYVRVGTSQRALAAPEPAVPPFNRVDVEVDSRARA